MGTLKKYLQILLKAVERTKFLSLLKVAMPQVYIYKMQQNRHKNTEKERAKGAVATSLCKQCGFVVLSPVGVTRDILGS